MAEVIEVLDPYEALGLDPRSVTDLAIRKAYNEAILRHPPDRDPAMFEKMRNAYEQVKEERDRLKLRVFGLKSKRAFAETLPEDTDRPRVGTEMWLAVIEAESRRRAKAIHY